MDCQVLCIFTKQLSLCFLPRPLFMSNKNIDTTSEFSLLFRQDHERLSDHDLLRLLADFRTLVFIRVKWHMIQLYKNI